METEARLFIQGELAGKFQLAWSYILDYENAANPFPERKETIDNRKNGQQAIPVKQKIYWRWPFS